MTITQLEYFLAAAEYGNLTRVAEQFFVSQPAVSNAIRDLEKEYQIQLFQRHHRTMTLTQDGQYFFQKAADLVDHYKSFHSDMSTYHSGKLECSFGISYNLATLYLPGLCKAANDAYPDLVLDAQELAVSEMLSKINTGLLDVACLAHNFTDDNSGFNRVKVDDFQLSLCVHKNLARFSESEISIHQLDGLPLALYRPGTTHNKLVRRLFAEASIQPNIRCEMVRSAYTAAFLPAQFFRDDPDVHVYHLDAMKIYPIYLVWKRTGPGINAFIKCAKGYFQNL